MWILNNIEVTIASKNLTNSDKVQAVSNEIKTYTIYPEEEYDNPDVWWDALEPEDFFDWEEGTFHDIDDPAEIEWKVSIDTMYLEEWIDFNALYWVREHHNLEEVPQPVVDKYEDLSDCCSIDTGGRDKRKFAVMKITKDGNGIRKTIWNEEGNFEEWENEDDKPDWVIENEERVEKVSKYKRDERVMKVLWKLIRENREKYKKLYDASDKLKVVYPKRSAELKKDWDKYYKEYLRWSKRMDKIKEADAKIAKAKKYKEAERILEHFVDFQQIAPSSVVDKLLREDVKEYYKTYWYSATIKYLNKCIAKAKTLL